MHRSARRSQKIDTAVECQFAQNRVGPPAEPGRDAADHRLCQGLVEHRTCHFFSPRQLVCHLILQAARPECQFLQAKLLRLRAVGLERLQSETRLGVSARLYVHGGFKTLDARSQLPDLARQGVVARAVPDLHDAPQQRDVGISGGPRKEAATKHHQQQQPDEQGQLPPVKVHRLGAPTSMGNEYDLHDVWVVVRPRAAEPTEHKTLPRTQDAAKPLPGSCAVCPPLCDDSPAAAVLAVHGQPGLTSRFEISPYRRAKRMAESSSPGCVSIGDGVKLSGRLDLPGIAYIDGEVEGEVLANEVRIGVTGRIKGSVTTAHADIHGEIERDVTVTDTLILRSTAKVRGSIVYEIIEIEQGATIEGELKRGEADKRSKSARVNPIGVVSPATPAAIGGLPPPETPPAGDAAS
ncbi:MAG: polymer-forming cytoskeletal protein [Rhodocyclaceae bacterium]|nr:polymer-forming cytoskeletal protein [Rhodocyclaceae bacterium]